MPSVTERELDERSRMLRAEVERRARRSFTDEGWEFFVEREVFEEEPFSHPLVERMLENLPYYDLVSQRPPAQRIAQGTQTESRRAYEDAAAWFATRHVPLPVDRFRVVVLADRLVPRRQARAWLNKRLKDEAQERDLPPAYRKLVSAPPDTLLPVFEIPAIELHDPVSGRDHWAPVAPGTDTDWLRRVAENRAADMGWTKGEAALWVISGVLPSMPMIRSVFKPAPRSNRFGERIEMAIDPATTPREVAEAYAGARARIVNKRVRTPTAKHLRLAVFGDQRPEGETWEESMRRWNEAHRRWHYTRLSNFWRDAVHAKRRFEGQRPLEGDRKAEA